MHSKKQPNRFANPAVKEVFAAYPKTVREPLLTLRQLILDTAAETAGVGEIDETLKWNEPAYVTTKSKSGSTVRINKSAGSDTKYSMYFNCNTTLVDSFRTLYPKTFHYRGNREIEFDAGNKLPEKELQVCIAMALTYHQKKK